MVIEFIWLSKEEMIMRKKLNSIKRNIESTRNTTSLMFSIVVWILYTVFVIAYTVNSIETMLLYMYCIIIINVIWNQMVDGISRKWKK